MSGQEIIQLTPSNQVNFMIIKSIFEAWQEELEKLKSNPYFDYRDIAVQESLKDFMNVLSRSIKIERIHFEPLLRDAVRQSILLAGDPLLFFQKEIERAKGGTLITYFKNSKKYLKWHPLLLSTLIDRSNMGASYAELKMALKANYEANKHQLEKPEVLLNPLNSVHPINFGELWLIENVHQSLPKSEAESYATDQDKVEIHDEPEHKEAHYSKETFEHHTFTGSTEQGIDPSRVWAKFESEEYNIMKGSITDLQQSVGINQRFMFTKNLFDGNPDQMKLALKSIDQCRTFHEAIQLLNERYVEQLGWNKDSEEVDEFLQLVFRRFEHKG